MRQTGIVRKLDDLGRIVIPIEVRRTLGWIGNTPIEISQFGQYILLHEQGDRETSSVGLRRGSLVLKELEEILNGLPDKDILLVLDILHRLAETTETPADNESL